MPESRNAGEKLVRHRTNSQLLQSGIGIPASVPAGQYTAGHGLVLHCSAKIVTFYEKNGEHFIYKCGTRKKDFNEQPAHALIATSTTPFPSLKTNPNTQRAYIVDERRAGGGSLVSLWMTKERAEQKFSPPSFEHQAERWWMKQELVLEEISHS